MISKEEKELLLKLFGYHWKNLHKAYGKRKVPKDWTGKQEPTDAMPPWNGKSDSDNSNFMSWNQLHHKDEEVWTKW